LQRLKKTHGGSSVDNLKNFIFDNTVIYQCPKCNKIMCVSNKGAMGATRNDGHHDHLNRCKPELFIMRFEGHIALTGYSNQDMPFWLWKL